MIIWPSRKPRSAVRGPTTSLNEKTSPGSMIVPSMKSAIRWTLWMRFDDEAPISVVNETSLRRIPSAFASAVVQVGRRADRARPAPRRRRARRRSPRGEPQRVDVATGP